MCYLIDLDKVGKSPARFDFAKLDHVNKHYIKAKTGAELFDLMQEWFDCEISESSKNRIILAAEFLKDRARVMCDLLAASKNHVKAFRFSSMHFLA